MVTSKATVAVWSLAVRLLHWTLALSMIGSFITHESGDALHEYLGYVALASASMRIVMGFVGNGFWRFSQFVRSLANTAAYAKDVIKHKERRYLGHNPLGAWMMLALLADAIATGFTGWLYTTDKFWGVEWVGELHKALGEVLLPLLFLHVAGAIFTSYRHRENLIASMLHGRKPAAKGSDIAS